MLRRFMTILSAPCLLVAILTAFLWQDSQSRWHELSLLRGRRYFALSAGNRLHLGVEVRRINSTKTNQLIPDSYSPTWTTFLTHGAFTPELSTPLLGTTHIGRASLMQGHIEDYTQHAVYFPHWLAIAILGAVPILSIVLNIRHKPTISPSRSAPPSLPVAESEPPPTAPASAPVSAVSPEPAPTVAPIIPVTAPPPTETTELDPIPLAPPTASVPLDEQHDHTFIETMEDEPAEAWQAAVLETFKLLSPQIPPSWSTFTAGPTIHYAGRRFLSLHNTAGSITPLLYNYAQRHALPRSLIIIVRQRSGLRTAHAWIDGVKSTFNATPLFASPPPTSDPSPLIEQQVS